MRYLRNLAVFAAFLLIIPRAYAQVTTSPADVKKAASPRRPVEIGAGVAMNSGRLTYEEVEASPTLDVHGTFPLKPRVAVEISMSVTHRDEPSHYAPPGGGERHTTYGSYEIVFGLRPRGYEHRKAFGFFTVGAVGFYKRVRDESVTSPRVAYTDMYPPMFPVVGGGFQARIASRLAVRADASLVVAGYATSVRTTVKAVVPIGRKTF